MTAKILIGIMLKALLAACIFGLVAWLLMHSAEAHKWYPKKCCSGEDCGEVVKHWKEGGFEWFKNEQGLVGAMVTKIVPAPSPDNKSHVCIDPEEGVVTCRFEPTPLF